MTTDPKQPEAQEAPASERDAFEKYARGRFDSIVRTVNGPYVWDDVQDAWHTWQARAALGKQPTQEAPADAKDAVLVRLRRLIRILDAGRDVDGYKGQSALQEAVDAIEAYRAKAARYDYLRSRDLDTISKGGVFAGQVPQNYVLSGVDLDRAIDFALQSHQEGK